jgi:hypothetical protein
MLGALSRWSYAKLGRRYARTVLWLQMQARTSSSPAGLLQLFIGADGA